MMIRPSDVLPVSPSSQSNLSRRENPHLLELHTIVWLSSLSKQIGHPVTLGNVPAPVWDELAAQGWNLLWLMGVWERSPASAGYFFFDNAAKRRFDAALPGWNPEQIVGSPYSVRNYQPDPRIGSWDDLNRARGELNSRGIGLVLDFVVNHVALDHPWTCEHPEFFIRGTEEDLEREPESYFSLHSGTGERVILAHGRDPYFPAWRDVAQLDLFSDATRNALLDVLTAISPHCDGLRCDMAMLALNEVFPRTWGAKLGSYTAPQDEFWTLAARAIPQKLLLAEVYWNLEPRLLRLGFQFSYDKNLYDLLLGDHAREVSNRLRMTAELKANMAHFLENHDEAPSAVSFGKERLPAAATLLATLPGLRFFYQGQMEGRKCKLPIELSTAAPCDPDAEIEQLYEKLLKIAKADVFHSGQWRLLDVTSAGDGSYGNLTAYEWRLDGEFWGIVANPCREVSQGRVHFSKGIEPGRQYLLSDELNDVPYLRDGSDIVANGLYVRLDPHRAHIFRIAAA